MASTHVRSLNALRLPVPVTLVAGGAIVLTISLASPWLKSSGLPALGLGSGWDYAAVAALTLGCTGLLAMVIQLCMTQLMGTGQQANMPRTEAAREIRDAAPYLTLMNEHLDGALKDSEDSALAVIERMNAIHAVSSQQFERIRETQESGKQLAQVVKDKVMVDSQLGAILTLFVEKQEAEAQANLERIKRLQGVKDLAPMVDAIGKVARQTNFLAINAAIEAARAGDSGRSFAVVAAEIRQLAQQTATVAVDITAKIDAATSGIDNELSKASEKHSKSTTSNNMRQVVEDIAAMQDRFVTSMSNLKLDQVVASILDGHEELSAKLADVLGQMQSQDVMRQRVGNVQLALQDLNGHMQVLAGQLHDRPWDPDSMTAIRDRLHDQANRYVMHSEHATHAMVTGQSTASSAPAPKIELF